ATSRINFRLPDHLKARIEEAATETGLSVNAWLIRAVTAILEPDNRDRGADHRTSRGGQSYTGWVR
ncbi:MAG: type II toxin-antitoxin system HicB family antitoxin, partial [Actinomycetota bacterium]|nr:type II toxin-antitoxin system HicB family antitoxin [Actinomycetota bacterium]